MLSVTVSYMQFRFTAFETRRCLVNLDKYWFPNWIKLPPLDEMSYKHDIHIRVGFNSRLAWIWKSQFERLEIDELRLQLGLEKFLLWIHPSWLKLVLFMKTNPVFGPNSTCSIQARAAPIEFSPNSHDKIYGKFGHRKSGFWSDVIVFLSFPSFPLLKYYFLLRS